MKKILMNKNTEVMVVEFDTTSKIFTDVYEIKNIDYAPLRVHTGFNSKSVSIKRCLNEWYHERAIPGWRKGLLAFLNNLELDSRYDLLNRNYDLSLSDQYWLKDENSNISWEDINYFHHDFEYDNYMRAIFEDNYKNEGKLDSPSNTTDGMLPKCWIIEDNKRILVKASYEASMQEPINEWLASEIARRLNFTYCPYTVDVYNNELISKCPNFISEDEEIITAYEVFISRKKSNNDSDYDHYLKILEEHGIVNAREEFENMLIVDFITLNYDRHLKNYGVIRNVNTLEWVRLTPIFDTGEAMECDIDTELMNFNDGYCKFFSNTHKTFSTVLELIQDISRIDISSLEGIEDDYLEVLKKYQDITGMSDERIERLVKGLKHRIDLLKLHKEEV